MIFINNKANSTNLINNIKDSINIVDIISNIITLNKKGNNFFGICPFHPDSNPSLTVSPQKQIYKCFVCNKGGDVLSFVKNYYHLTLWETLEKINEMSNFKFDLPKNNRISNFEQKLSNNIIIKVNEKANAFFQYNLLNSNNDFKNYLLNERKLTINIITKYNIGCSSQKDNLRIFLNAHDFSNSDILKSNLMSMSDKGSDFRDFFINRIIFPIKNEFGMTVGFSGRSIEKDVKAKYINSKESIVFKKSQLLYNLHNAKRSRSLLDDNEIIIVEGFMDVIALDLIGFSNTIAIMGLSISQWQIDKIKSLSKNIVLFLDNDNAGIKSSFKFINTFINNGFSVKVVHNKVNKDPYDIFQELGLEKLKEVFQDKIEWYQFKVNVIINSSKNENEKVNLIIKLHDNLKTSILKNNLIHYIRNYNTEIYKRIDEIINNNKVVIPRKIVDNKLKLVKLMIVSKFYTLNYIDKIYFIPDEKLNIIASYIVKYYNRYDYLEKSNMINFFNAEIKNNTLKEYAITILNQSIKEFNNLIESIVHEVKEKHISDIKQQILQEKDPKLKKIKISELTKLT